MTTAPVSYLYYHACHKIYWGDLTSKSGEACQVFLHASGLNCGDFFPLFWSVFQAIISSMTAIKQWHYCFTCVCVCIYIQMHKHMHMIIKHSWQHSTNLSDGFVKWPRTLSHWHRVIFIVEPWCPFIGVQRLQFFVLFP